MNVDIDLSPIAVLVIDDSRFERSFIKTSLQSFGVRTVYEASDGPGGAEILSGDRKVDVLIVDHDMTPMDGIEFTRFLRGGGAPKAIEKPVIMLSGVAELETVIVARNAGVNEFLIKPLAADALFRRLRNVVVHPRAFVANTHYTGPCRRTADKPPPGAERRRAPPLPKPKPLIDLPPDFKPLPQKMAVTVHRRALTDAPPPPPPPQARTSKRAFKAGAIIFNEGERGEEAYVIEKGKVAIFKTIEGKQVVLGSLGPNGIFGEMALIDDEPRMASAMAETETTCLIIPKPFLKGQIGKTPELVMLVLETLLHDIRKMGRDLVQVRATVQARRKMG